MATSSQQIQSRSQPRPSHSPAKFNSTAVRIGIQPRQPLVTSLILLLTVLPVYSLKPRPVLEADHTFNFCNAPPRHLVRPSVFTVETQPLYLASLAEHLCTRVRHFESISCSCAGYPCQETVINSRFTLFHGIYPATP